MKTVEKILDILSKIVKILLIVTVSIIVISLTAQVIARYVFNHGIVWSDELARYCLIYISILGAVLVTQENKHISVNFLDNLLGTKAKWVMDIIRLVISAVFSALVISFTGDAFAAIKGSVSTAMHLPMEIIYAVYPFSFACMLLYQIFNIIKEFMYNNPWIKGKTDRKEENA